MSKIPYYFYYFILLSLPLLSSSTPIFPTILILSTPTNSTHSEINSNFVRWLQASGADVLPVRPGEEVEKIDFFLTKVNGILFQGNLGPLDFDSDYYKTANYIINKVELIYRTQRIKIPVLVIGDDMAMVLCILNNNSPVHSEIPLFKSASTLFPFIPPYNTLILSELESSDIKIAAEKQLIANQLTKVINLEFIKNKIKSNSFFEIVASFPINGENYVSILEGTEKPLVMISFHPEMIAFENRDEFEIPNELEAVKMSRFIGNAFVFYGRKNVPVEVTVEEKEKLGYIDPYGELPEGKEGRYSYFFEKK